MLVTIGSITIRGANLWGISLITHRHCKTLSHTQLNTMPTKYKLLLDLYDMGGLPPDEQIDLIQFLIDTELREELHQYAPICEYFILEGLCYDVAIHDT